MAKVTVIDKTYDSMTWKVSELGFQAYTYPEFKIEVEDRYGDLITTKKWVSSNTTYDTQVKVTGLEENTRYYGTIYAYYKNAWVECGTDYDTTSGIEVQPPEITSISISDITSTSFYYTVSSKRVDYFDIEVYQDGYLIYSIYNTLYYYGTIRNLEPSTEYKLNVSAYNKGGKVYSYKYVTTSSAPKVSAPSLTITPSITSATVSWVAPSGASRLVYSLKNISTQSWVAENQSFTASLGKGLLSNLSQNTNYTIWAYYEPKSGYSKSNTVEYSFTTVSKPTFYWTTEPKQGEAFSITASDWKKLQDTINAWREIKGLSAWTFSRPNRGDTFTFYHFNDVVLSMEGLVGKANLPNQVLPGDPCKASDFVAFKNLINKLTV